MAMIFNTRLESVMRSPMITQKRSRSEFESDLQTSRDSFVIYGTPLPHVDSGTQDDGSYVPVWKQEVRDERGRKRLHGAFTGGFSAGYFNTVGSKEGWTPSSFTSSRSNKRNDDQITERERRAKFMDEEDLANEAEAQVLYTKNEFNGLGFTADARSNFSYGMSQLSASDDNIGLRLLRKLGWDDIQPTGPFAAEHAYLKETNNYTTLHTTASRTMHISALTRKPSPKGLGFVSSSHLDRSSNVNTASQDGNRVTPSLSQATAGKSKKNMKQRHKVFSTVMSDDVDLDDDMNTIGPRILYNRAAASDLKVKKVNLHKKHCQRPTNPLIGSQPSLRPDKHGSCDNIVFSRTDGKVLLTGFSLAETLDETAGNSSSEAYRPQPTAPEGWKSSRTSIEAIPSDHRPVSEVAKMTELNPNARANILGETTLPGKSVFDFISSASRDRLVEVTGRDDLPRGLGEMPFQAQVPDETLETKLPRLDKEIALAALGRGVGGWMPYAENEQKRARYRAFMEYCAGIRSQLPQTPAIMTRDNFLLELREFSQAAAVFKPMTGMMASRFASASSSPGANTGKELSQPLAKPTQAKPEDSAEAAASLGMFGPLTRHSFRFFPSKLVCKRFNIPLPAHVQDSRPIEESSQVRPHAKATNTTPDLATSLKTLATSADLNKAFKERPDEVFKDADAEAMHEAKGATEAPLFETSTIDTSRNTAIEAEKAGEALFRAVFGDDSDSN